MSKAFRNVARASLLIAMAALAPAASAVGQEPETAADGGDTSLSAVSRATLRAVHETAAPATIHAWISEAVRAHEEKVEDRRVAREVHAEAEKLRPGRYVWRPERATSGPVEIVVSLKAQRAYVFRDRKLIAVSTVSTGRRGHVTPTGSFPILEKRRRHFSNLYDNAPMPNMQRMTWDGVALHAGAIPGYPASHGCVRLPMEFSNLLFGVTRIGSVVHVIADTPATSLAALDHALQAAASGSGRQARAR